jgi:hypothetical protein
MALRKLKCGRCPRYFETDATNRRNCYVCSPQRLKTAGDPIPVEPRYIPPAPPERSPGTGRLERATLAELERLEQAETIEGVLAILLARDLDGADVPGAQRTSMSKQLSAMMADIRALAPKEPDALDDYQARIRKLREEA